MVGIDHQPVRVALVGCGAVSQRYYAPALKELESRRLLRVQRLFDPDEAMLDRLRRTFPAAAYLTALTEICDTNTDLAIIASPVCCHAEQAIQLLGQGLTVLCEKPMAGSVAEARRMIEAATSGTGQLAVALVRRFFPATQTIRDIISRELLGELRTFSFAEGGQFRWPVSSLSYFDREIARGGVFMDIGVHALDLMLWWFGDPLELYYDDDAMGGIEVNCRVLCTFSQGLVGELRLSRDCTLENRYVIHGTKGWLAWDVNQADKIQLGLDGSTLVLDAQLRDPAAFTFPPRLGPCSSNFEQSFVAQLCNVAAAVRGAEALAVSGEEGIRSLDLIERCYRARAPMPMPWLGEVETRRAQQGAPQI